MHKLPYNREMCKTATYIVFKTFPHVTMLIKLFTPGSMTCGEYSPNSCR